MNRSSTNNDITSQAKQAIDLLNCLPQQEDEGLNVSWKFNGTTIRFGWDSPLTVEEEHGVEMEVEQDFYPRYSNQWSQTEWGSKVIGIEAGGHVIEMDLDSIAIKTFIQDTQTSGVRPNGAAK